MGVLYSKLRFPKKTTKDCVQFFSVYPDRENSEKKVSNLNLLMDCMQLSGDYRRLCEALYNSFLSKKNESGDHDFSNLYFAASVIWIFLKYEVDFRAIHRFPTTASGMAQVVLRVSQNFDFVETSLRILESERIVVNALDWRIYSILEGEKNTDLVFE